MIPWYNPAGDWNFRDIRRIEAYWLEPDRSAGSKSISHIQEHRALLQTVCDRLGSRPEVTQSLRDCDQVLRA